MTLRLDPHRPIVWRTPRSLQIGVDPVLAHLNDVSDGDARLVDALAVGVTRSGLSMLAERAGVPPCRVDELLAGLSGALAPPAAPAAAPPVIAVVGVGVGAQRVAGVLAEAGHPVALSTPAAPYAAESASTSRARRPAVAVLVSAHVADPREHQRWLRRDVPHLPIVFGEAAVTIGPLVQPGSSACLGCVEQRRTRVDPARTAIATQLWGTAAAAESAALATEAAVEAVRMLRSGTTGRSVRLDTGTGERTVTAWQPDDECGCRGLTASPALAPRRETGSVRAPRARSSPAVPTRAPAPFAPV